MENTLVSVENIEKNFGGVKALQNVSLSIKAGEVRCLAGENGSGKSTLIKIIGGVYQKDKGEIFINDTKYENLQPIEAMREGIQIIFQDFSLFPNMTVAENLAINTQMVEDNKFINWKRVRQIANKALEQIGLDIDIYKKVEELSMADRQLIAISRALLHNARLIIMDEPTSALTRKEVNTLFEIIEKLKQKDISILFVSHKLNEVMTISDKITVLRNGKKVYDDLAKKLDRKKLEYYMTGRELSEKEPFVYEKGNKKCLFKVENLNKRNKYNNINFKLFEGEILGITGLLGSGRSALAYSLFGLSPADKGKFYIEGKETKINSVTEAMDNKIGYVPEDRLTEGLILDKSIDDNINICTIDDLVNDINLIKNKDKKKQAENWINELSIKASSTKMKVRSLSGGNQQRVVVAKWLATQPKILILNGPTVGVDVGSKEELYNLLKKLAEEGMGIILISDDIPEVVYNCNRILLMKEGEITEEYTGSNIDENFLSKKLIENK